MPDVRAPKAGDLAAIARFNATQTPFPSDTTVPALIEAQVARHDARVALLRPGAADASVTYADLNARANRLAHWLRADGVGPGQVVALQVERSVEMVVGILGVLKAGAAYLPMARDWPPERAAFVLRDARARVLLVHPRPSGRVPFAGRRLSLDAPALARGDASNPAPQHGPLDLAYVIYTSGSTGDPKGVMIEHRSLVNRLHWMQRAYPIAPGDVILQKTPYTFDVSVWELLWWALAGAALSLLPPGGEWNPPAIIETVARHRVSVMHFVPSMLNVFLEYLQDHPDRVARELASVRRVFVSGEALGPHHVRRFNDIWRAPTGAALTNLYGPTEATVDVTAFDCPADRTLATVPIGRPIQNMRMYVVRDGRQVGIGEPGELCIAGVGLARGYLNDPALTREKFVTSRFSPRQRMYRTGDLGRWRRDGNLEFLGREDHQVKVRGLRIELGEIEAVMRAFPGVRDAAVFVVRRSESVALIVGHVACWSTTDLGALRAYLQGRLPGYMVPHRIERIDRMPMTGNGKLDRSALQRALQRTGQGP